MMHFLKNRFAIKKITLLLIGFVVISIVSIIIVNLRCDNKKRYSILTDTNNDGVKEKLTIEICYYYHYFENVCDADYTTNDVVIFLNDEEIFSGEYDSLDALINPKLIKSTINNKLVTQLYFHDSGGGPSVPMNYFFNIVDNKVEVKREVSDY